AVFSPGDNSLFDSSTRRHGQLVRISATRTVAEVGLVSQTVCSAPVPCATTPRFTVAEPPTRRAGAAPWMAIAPAVPTTTNKPAAQANPWRARWPAGLESAVGRQ